MTALERDQIPDSVKWARFRGLARLHDAAPAAITIASVWIVRRLRHQWLVSANQILARLIA